MTHSVDPDAALGSLDRVFDRIWIINLATRSDRREQMTEELARIGLAPGKGPVQFFEARRPPDAGPFPSIGARGCFESHQLILAQAAADGIGSLLILEDDAAFATDITARLAPVIAGLGTQDWDVFYGGYEGLGQTADRMAATELQPVAPETRIGLTHCVGLRGSAIGECAAYLHAMMHREGGSSEGGPMHVDGAYSWYRKTHPARRTLAAVPAIAFQRPSRSDIFEGLAWYDRMALLGPLLTALRSLKHRFKRR